MKNFLRSLILLLILGLFTVSTFAQDNEIETSPTVDGPTVQNITAAEGGSVFLGDAPETTDSPAARTNDPVMIAIVVVLALLLTGALVFQSRLIALLAKLVPPETAASIYQSGVRFGYQIALDRAAVTETPLDDEFFMAGAKAKGFVVEKLEGGGYLVKPPVVDGAAG